MTKLARSPDPRKRAALEQYARGERRQAYAVLEELARAENQARQKAASIASAATLRELTPLALDMKDRGDTTTTEVIGKYEAIVALDPGVAWDWIELARLYQEAGQLERAEHATRQGVDLARAEVKAASDSSERRRDLAVALGERGKVQVATGDLAAARKLFEESLAIRRELSRSNPGSAAARRDVWVSLIKLGLATKDPAHFKEALAILRALEASGQMLPGDQQYLEELEAQVSSGP